MKKNMIKNISISALLLLSVSLHYSCSDFLDIVPDNTATVDHAFKKKVQAEKYLYGVYGFLPTFAHPANNPAFLAGEESWLFNEFAAFGINAWRIAMGEQGTQSPLVNYWAAQSSNYGLNGGQPIFTGIRDCNIFLENIHKTIDLDGSEKELWIAEVKVLKAIFHAWLLNMYGPIPIIDVNVEVEASTAETMYYREPVDDVVDYIVSLIDEAAPDLPENIMDVTQDLGRITRPIALAVKAKVLTFAASPLFNGNPEYVNMVDKRGKHLFPQSYDPEKWKRAAVALKEAIDASHEAGHALFDINSMSEIASLVSPETLVALQAKGAATERWNPEIIWGDAQDNTVTLQRFGLHAFIHWNTYSGHTTRSWAPTLNTVKQFYTKNGVPIDEDKEWIGRDIYSLRAGDEAHRYYIEPNYKTLDLHFDREPRFYGAITFDGSKFYGIEGSQMDTNMPTTILRYGNVMWYNNAHSITGYLAKKMVHRRSSLSMTSISSSIHRYAFPVIRLADLYLLYAEVLNEIGEASEDEIFAYVDPIRERSGLDGVIESWANHSINPDKPLTQEGRREIIQRERMIELAFEGQRYWDLRRWKLLKEYMNKPVQGWDIYAREAEEFYKIQTLATPNFEEKDYLWPIRQGNLMRNRNLVQNPGW
ncbi:MAG: RagB/SusD family nutrient uptake outer membrane protein [Bacteroidota bacterium]|jgi:hypothetical protein|nr:RagB/SusD family nutrient uptake outer membrane protein [Bacteroidota bacterium]